MGVDGNIDVRNGHGFKLNRKQISTRTSTMSNFPGILSNTIHVHICRLIFDLYGNYVHDIKKCIQMK